ncbi:craniofacial development protein 2-like [Palaemon carinicauda]|uniref:craniofacial development protein 2-like n=1 Tax=Palaemon carinicauda TaxID=392227 RepID=UPI0035B649A1
MNEIGELQQLESESMKYSLDILFLSEARCKGIDKETLDQGNIHIYSGRSDGVGREGVGMMMTPKAEKALTEWRVVYSRLLLAKFKSKECNMSIMVCYAPINDSLEERKDEYYKELQRIIGEIPERIMKIVNGDFNTKVGKNNQGIENVIRCRGSW